MHLRYGRQWPPVYVQEGRVPHPRTRLHSVSRKRPQTMNTYRRFCKT